MSIYRLYCSDCGAGSETYNEGTVHSLVMVHDEKDGHSPDYEEVER